MSIKYIKIFAERNSGSRWHAQLLDANFSVGIFPLRNPEKRDQLDFKRTGRIKEQFDKSEAPRERHALEAWKDARDKLREQEGYGWKHGAVLVDQVEVNQYFDDTGFVCLVKNPFWFVRSLHQRPYNKLARVNKMSLDRFAMSEWPLLGRDRLPGKTIASPVHLWMAKVRSYFELRRRHPEKCVILRYEDTIVDVHATLDTVAEKLAIARKPYTPIETDTKAGEVRGIEYYQEKYLSTDYETSYAPETLAFMNAALDPEIMAELDYPMARVTA